MSLPNLASRPFLNTRPAWVLSVAAGLLTLVLVVINLVLFLSSGVSLEQQLELRNQLIEERKELTETVLTNLASLDRVEWRSLSSRIEGANTVLREHSFSWLLMLDDVGRVMPWNVRLSRIGPSVGEEGVTLSIEGTARDRAAFLGFLDNMIADPVFAEPLPQSERSPEEAGGEGYTFSMTVKYRPMTESP